MAFTVRPSRPMTLPTSSGATFSSNSVPPSAGWLRSSTWSGRSTSPRARDSNSSSTASGLGGLAGALDEPGDGLGRSGARLQPVLQALLLELDLRGLEVRVVRPDRLDELA